MKDELIQISGKAYQKCEVIMLPTKEQRWKVGNQHDDRYESYSFVDKKLYSRQSNAYNWSLSHLYILSSEEIKEGDLCLIDNNVGQSKGYQVLQCKKIDIDNGWYYFKDFKTGRCKKIIATTDFSLGHWNGEVIIGNFKSLPRPSDDFIKAFVEKQGKIDKVLVEVICNKLSQCNCTDNYSCLGTKLKVAPDNTITIRAIQEVYVSKKVLPFVIEALGFDPTKEKEKTSWNREEVVEILKKFDIEMGDTHGPTTRNKWIEENL